jgi:sugar/nucleoside kinase (ribokinase family)
MKIQRNGIALIGSSLVDELLQVMSPGQLLYVDAERYIADSELKQEKIEYSVGGMALNVAVDLAKISGMYPIKVIGKVGKDENAALIRKMLHDNNLSDEGLITAKDDYTSWTEVIHISMPGRCIERVFRYRLGAMGSFVPDEVDLNSIDSFKIAMFGYGLVLPQFDLVDEECGTKMGRLLRAAQHRGLKTGLDFVSPSADNMFKFRRYRKTLQFVNVCCINEDQAAGLTDIINPVDACRALVEDLGAGLAVVHCGAEGPNYLFSTELGLLVQPNFMVKPENNKGNAGAGDAFTAGMLHGLHQNWELDKTLRFATAAAAISLDHVSCTGAMRDEAFILEYGDTQPILKK